MKDKTLLEAYIKEALIKELRFSNFDRKKNVSSQKKEDNKPSIISKIYSWFKKPKYKYYDYNIEDLDDDRDSRYSRYDRSSMMINQVIENWVEIVEEKIKKRISRAAKQDIKRKANYIYNQAINNKKSPKESLNLVYDFLEDIV